MDMDKVSINNLGGGFMKYLLLVCVIYILSGCDIAYRSSAVREDDGVNVSIVPITLEIVLKANSSPYEPQSLPGVFGVIEKYEQKVSDSYEVTKKIHEPEQYFGAIETRLPVKSYPQPYKIGVGDVVMLSTPEAADIVEALNGLLASQNRRQGYTVQDDGAVSIPDIGRVIIGGLTLSEAEDAIFRQLVEVGVSPSFSIEVTEFNSQRVSVSGAVVSPGIEPISMQPLYLDQALSRRGGVAINDVAFVIIRLYRNGSIYQISLAELYRQDTSLKILLKDGDAIVVETTKEYNNLLGLRQKARSQSLLDNRNKMWARADESRIDLARLQFGTIPREYVYIIGEVGEQSRFTLPFENKAVLADALLESGGVLSLSGNPEQIYLFRETLDNKNSTSIEALHLDATNAANFILATRLELRPKDVVFVGTQPVTNWNRVLNQIIPSLQFSRK